MTKFKTFWRPIKVLNSSFIKPLTFTNYFKSARFFSKYNVNPQPLCNYSMLRRS